MDQGKDGIKLCQNQDLQEKLELFKDHIHENPNHQVASPLLPNFQETLLQAEQANEIKPSFPYREMVGSLGYLARVRVTKTYSNQIPLGARTIEERSFKNRIHSIRTTRCRYIYQRYTWSSNSFNLHKITSMPRFSEKGG